MCTEFNSGNLEVTGYMHNALRAGSRVFPGVSLGALEQLYLPGGPPIEKGDIKESPNEVMWEAKTN